MDQAMENGRRFVAGMRGRGKSDKEIRAALNASGWGAEQAELVMKAAATAGLFAALAAKDLREMGRCISAGADVNAVGDGGTPLIVAVRDGNRKAVEELLKARADANAADGKGTRAVHEAAALEDAGILRRLLKARAAPNVADRSGKTPLHCAVEEGRREAAERLLQAGADAKAADDEGKTPLHGWRGDAALLRALLRAGADVNAPDRKRWTPLHDLLLKCVADAPGAVRLLIEAGADVNARERSGRTPLALATSGGDLGVARLLLEAAHVGPTDPGVVAAFHMAARSGQLEALRWLLDFGVHVGATGEWGKTALHWAAAGDWASHPEAVQLLLEAGADANCRDGQGWAPLDCMANQCVEGGDSELQAGREAGRLLVDAGADVNAGGGPLERTPLHRVVEALTLGVQPGSVWPRCGPTVRLLLDLGADPRVSDCQGTTPLHALVGVDQHGVAAGHLDEAAQLLIRAGANVNAADQAGQTPLHRAAARRERCEAVRLLLGAAADINAADKEGRTPLHHAVLGHRNCEVVRALLDAGADVGKKDKDGKTPLALAEGRTWQEAVDAMQPAARRPAKRAPKQAAKPKESAEQAELRARLTSALLELKPVVLRNWVKDAPGNMLWFYGPMVPDEVDIPPGQKWLRMARTVEFADAEALADALLSWARSDEYQVEWEDDRGSALLVAFVGGASRPSVQEKRVVWRSSVSQQYELYLSWQR